VAGGSKTLRDALLPLVDGLRGLPGLFGLRLHVASILVRTWSGPRVGEGVSTDVTSGLKIDRSLANVKVRNVRQHEVIASGGLYTDQDLVVGPITPPYTGSTLDNDAIAIFDPPVTGIPTEVLFNVQGPGYSAAGDWFVKFSQRTDQPFRYMIWLRKTGQQA
jgi:hypothetical protein